MEPDIWNNYPPELLTEAAQRVAEAETNLLAKEPCDPDPYNVSLSTLIHRWWERKQQ